MKGGARKPATGSAARPRPPSGRVLAPAVGSLESDRRRIVGILASVEKADGGDLALCEAIVAEFETEGRVAEIREIRPDYIEVLLWSDNLERRIGIRRTKEDAKPPGELVTLFDKSNKPGYTVEPPPSPPADTSRQKGMREDFNIALAVERRLANYEMLARHVDLENPALGARERLTRAERLLTAYREVRRVNQDFKDSNVQLTAARRIQKAAYRQRQKAKHPPAPRGRPRTKRADI